jgi:hypothetical protein
MQKIFLTPVLIAGFVMASIAPAHAWTNPPWTTYRAGYEQAESFWRFWKMPEYFFSSKTGKLINSQVLKWCKTYKSFDDDKYPSFRKGGVNGCVAAIKDSSQVRKK